MTSSGVIYALDFDGVLCDSVQESSVTGVLAGRAVWPGSAMGSAAGNDAPPEWLLRSMTRARPIIETGYENVVLARALAERGSAEAADGLVDSLLAEPGDWTKARDSFMTTWGVDKDTLVEAFGKVRDDWIARDQQSWIEANRFYPGIVEALNLSTEDVYIVTTKQARFVKALLEANGVHRISEDRIFGLGSGTKISVLKKIIAMPESKGKKVLFVEDRYPAVEAVSISMLGQPLKLFLASWGYNTENDRRTAEKHPFIDILDLPTFTGRL